MTLQLTLPEKELLLLKINDEIEYRKKINPLEWHELMPTQDYFRKDPAKVKFLWGGNRSGKSELGAHYVLEFALSHKKARIWVISQTFQDSIAIQQRKIYSLCPKKRVKYGFYDEINGFRNRKLLFDNGSLILFKSYDQNTDSFASDDIDLILFDEEPPINIYRECRMRLIDRDGQMIFTMTSVNGITELIEEIFEGYEVVESQYAPLVDEVLPRIAEKDGMKFYFLHTTENPHINQERVIQEARLMPRQEIRSRIYGMPTNLTGKIYPAFNKRVHVISSLDDMPEGAYNLWSVIDPHDRKPWAMAWFAVHSTDTIYCVDEYPNQNFNEMLFDDKTIDEYTKIIKQKEAELKAIFGVGVTRRRIDPNFGNKTVKLAERQGGQSSTTVKKELTKRGLTYRDSIDALEDGHLKVREFIHYESKHDEIIVQPKLLYLEHCQNSIRHLSRYSRKDISAADGDVKDKVGPQEKYKDFCDLARYLVMANPRYVRDQKEEPKEEKKHY